MEQVDQRAKSQLPLLEGRGITKTFTRGDEVILALKGVSFQIFPAEFVAITGASGSGKSTLLYILGLIDTPTQGSYRLLDQETSSMTDDQRAALRNHYIGFIFQSFHLLPRATALDNVMLPMLYAASHGSGIPRREQRQRAEECLRIVGLQDRMLHVPNQLSGGQRQRVAIARALAMRPRLLLADEPTGNLDSKTGMEIMLLLEQLRGDGVTVVMVTHEPRLASRAGRIIHFVDGYAFA